jgi:hypothetical protein
MTGFVTFSSVLLMGLPMIYMLAGRADGWRFEDAVYLSGGVILTAASPSHNDVGEYRRISTSKRFQRREHHEANLLLSSGRLEHGAAGTRNGAGDPERYHRCHRRPEAG